jgi:hypothetical protein
MGGGNDGEGEGDGMSGKGGMTGEGEGGTGGEGDGDGRIGEVEGTGGDGDGGGGDGDGGGGDGDGGTIGDGDGTTGDGLGLGGGRGDGDTNGDGDGDGKHLVGSTSPQAMAASMSWKSQQGSHLPSGVLGRRAPPLLLWLLRAGCCASWRTRACAGDATSAATTRAARTTAPVFHIARGIVSGRRGAEGTGRAGEKTGKKKNRLLRGRPRGIRVCASLKRARALGYLW